MAHTHGNEGKNQKSRRSMRNWVIRWTSDQGLVLFHQHRLDADSGVKPHSLLFACLWGTLIARSLSVLRPILTHWRKRDILVLGCPNRNRYQNWVLSYIGFLFRINQPSLEQRFVMHYFSWEYVPLYLFFLCVEQNSPGKCHIRFPSPCAIPQATFLFQSNRNWPKLIQRESLVHIYAGALWSTYGVQSD